MNIDHEVLAARRDRDGLAVAAGEDFVAHAAASRWLDRAGAGAEADRHVAVRHRPPAQGQRVAVFQPDRARYRRAGPMRRLAPLVISARQARASSAAPETRAGRDEVARFQRRAVGGLVRDHLRQCPEQFRDDWCARSCGVRRRRRARRWARCRCRRTRDRTGGGDRRGHRGLLGAPAASDHAERRQRFHGHDPRRDRGQRNSCRDAGREGSRRTGCRAPTSR